MHSAGQSATYESVMPKDHDIVLYRMVLPDHVCPYGLLAKRMLDTGGRELGERQLLNASTRARSARANAPSR